MKLDEIKMVSRALHGGCYIEPEQDLNEEIERMLYVVAEIVGVKKSDIESNGRQKDKVIARHIACYYLYNVFGMTLTQIGKMLKKHHSSVIHALREHDGRYACDKEYQSVFDKSSVYVL